MLNKVYDNIYTDEEKNQLDNYILNTVYRSPNYAMEKELGRYYGVIQDKLMSYDSIGLFPENLLDKVRLLAEKHFNVDGLQIFDIIIIKYCTDYGLVPKLDMHKDGGILTKYTIDYQHSSNIDWGVMVEDKEFYLSDNSALTFIGTKQLHGRLSRKFNPTDYVQNIFFQFTEKRK
jgi:hypothetical protein